MVDTVHLDAASAPTGGMIGNGTPINLTAGVGGTTSGNGGDVTITAGAAPTSGAGGAIHLVGGDGKDFNAGGNVTLQSGNGNIDGTSGGDVNINASDGSPGGWVKIFTGTALFGSEANGGRFRVELGSGDGGGIQGQFLIVNLPTSNPGVPNALWNDAGTLKIV